MNDYPEFDDAEYLRLMGYGGASNRQPIMSARDPESRRQHRLARAQQQQQQQQSDAAALEAKTSERHASRLAKAAEGGYL